MTADSRVDEVSVPVSGVWRIGQATDPYNARPPLSVDELNSPRVGNRFDSPDGSYGVLYFGTSLEACFGEVLGRFRPASSLSDLVAQDWHDESWMPPREMPADWRHRRLVVRAKPTIDIPMLDVESQRTREYLAKKLAIGLAAYGVADLDIAAVRSGDRRITRLISFWAWIQQNEDGSPRYGGVRYLSRLNNDWECWAVFDRVPTQEVQRRPIARSLPELHTICELYGIRVF